MDRGGRGDGRGRRGEGGAHAQEPGPFKIDDDVEVQSGRPGPPPGGPVVEAAQRGGDGCQDEVARLHHLEVAPWHLATDLQQVASGPPSRPLLPPQSTRPPAPLSPGGRPCATPAGRPPALTPPQPCGRCSRHRATWRLLAASPRACGSNGSPPHRAASLWGADPSCSSGAPRDERGGAGRSCAAASFAPRQLPRPAKKRAAREMRDLGVKQQEGAGRCRGERRRRGRGITSRDGERFRAEEETEDHRGRGTGAPRDKGRDAAAWAPARG